MYPFHDKLETDKNDTIDLCMAKKGCVLCFYKIFQPILPEEQLLEVLSHSIKQPSDNKFSYIKPTNCSRWAPLSLFYLHIQAM